MDAAIDQKRASSMNDLVQNFSKPGELVLDAFEGTLFTEKACPMAETCMQIFGSDKNRN